MANSSNAALLSPSAASAEHQIGQQREQSDEQRDAFEGPILAKMRSDLNHQMANARNAINKEFCRAALVKLDEYQEQRRKEKIESFMHVEAHTDGH